MIASAKETDALDITLSSCINPTNEHPCNYYTKLFVIVENTCVCRRSVDNKAAILFYPIESLVQTLAFALAEAVAEALVYTLPQTLEDAKVKTLQDTQDDV